MNNIILTPYTRYLSKVSALRVAYEKESSHSDSILALIGNQSSEPFVFNGKAYLLCITPRSGSTFFSDILGKTQSLGQCHEHFPSEMGGLVPSWMNECSGLADAFGRLQRNAQPLDFFGIKGTPLQMFPLITAGAFGNPSIPLRYIYLRRKDILRQAISLCRAAKTGEWHSDDPNVSDPEISIDEIVTQMKLLRRMEADWEVIFHTLGIAPFRLFYEELLAEPLVTYSRVGEYLGVKWKKDPLLCRSDFLPLVDRYDPIRLKHLTSTFNDIPLPG